MCHNSLIWVNIKVYKYACLTPWSDAHAKQYSLYYRLPYDKKHRSYTYTCQLFVDEWIHTCGVYFDIYRIFTIIS